MPGLEKALVPGTWAYTLSFVEKKALAWGNQPHTKRLFRIASAVSPLFGFELC
jgi:hypothetical protein